MAPRRRAAARPLRAGQNAPHPPLYLLRGGAPPGAAPITHFSNNRTHRPISPPKPPRRLQSLLPRPAPPVARQRSSLSLFLRRRLHSRRRPPLTAQNRQEWHPCPPFASRRGLSMRKCRILEKLDRVGSFWFSSCADDGGAARRRSSATAQQRSLSPSGWESPLDFPMSLMGVILEHNLMRQSRGEILKVLQKLSRFTVTQPLLFLCWVIGSPAARMYAQILLHHGFFGLGSSNGPPSVIGCEVMQIEVENGNHKKIQCVNPLCMPRRWSAMVI